MEKNKIKNPIIGGFYPDPSICRVGKDFYIINSSFSTFPGIPIFHSEDLANWQQIGYVLNRPSQLKVCTYSITGGLMAPTIRYHKGIFYVICTNMDHGGNFIVTATDPAGPWSEPFWLEDVKGIDASLYFDEDGRAYVTGTGSYEEYPGKNTRGIWISEIDLDKMKLIGGTKFIWNSALRNASSPEAPHIYKKDGYYYLVIAEGGTEFYHAVTVARSRELFGWYEGNPANPIMTHRHLGKTYPISNIGHADFVELEDGSWYAVMLGSRIFGGHHKNLGRETYLAPVTWEEDWPLISPETGKIEWSYEAPNLPWKPFAKPPTRDDFDQDHLGLQWNFLGNDTDGFWELRDSKLILRLLPYSVTQELKSIREANRNWPVPSISFVGRRQEHINFKASVKLEFHSDYENETAGFMLMQACNHHYRMDRISRGGKQLLQLILSTADISCPQHIPGFKAKTTQNVLAEVEIQADTIYLMMEEKGQNINFYYGEKEGEWKTLYENADVRLINPEIVGGMVGTYLGLYTSSNGMESNNKAEIDWFDYIGYENY